MNKDNQKQQRKSNLKKNESTPSKSADKLTDDEVTHVSGGNFPRTSPRTGGQN